MTSKSYPQVPYGWNGSRRSNGLPACVNAEPGTFSHECGKPASWIGSTQHGHRACYCDDCKERGHEARFVVEWTAIEARAAA